MGGRLAGTTRAWAAAANARPDTSAALAIAGLRGARARAGGREAGGGGARAGGGVSSPLPLLVLPLESPEDEENPVQLEPDSESLLLPAGDDDEEEEEEEDARAGGSGAGAGAGGPPPPPLLEEVEVEARGRRRRRRRPLPLVWAAGAAVSRARASMSIGACVQRVETVCVGAGVRGRERRKWRRWRLDRGHYFQNFSLSRLLPLSPLHARTPTSDSSPKPAISVQVRWTILCQGAWWCAAARPRGRGAPPPQKKNTADASFGAASFS